MSGPAAAGTPAALGYRMPAEWEPHLATWIAWPHERSDWPGPGKLEAVRWVYGEVIRHLAPGELVRVLVESEAAQRQVYGMCERIGVAKERVECFRVPTDRSWTRDSCPIFVRNDAGEVAATGWRFNGWAKYPNHKRDQKVPPTVARWARRRLFTPVAEIGGRTRRLVLEGGAVDSNGRGTMLVTEECLLSSVQARNPGLGREATERALRDWLGARHVVWLGEGIAGDDTHGHVDDLARFVDPATVALVMTDDPSDENHARLHENHARLARATDQDGRPLRVVTLPMPAAVRFDGERLPASYANFYVGNEAVLVPTFNDPADRRALATLADLFPSRRVVGIHAVDLVLGLGTIHCMTQQEPR
ncbi:MAG TPA: agmatine deiminase family protein [Candidatus Eisenbacteria bacterium]|nr:agmatine deiminase family protein [Candidatus Eisenbacteria bacterium]